MGATDVRKQPPCLAIVICMLHWVLGSIVCIFAEAISGADGPAPIHLPHGGGCERQCHVHVEDDAISADYAEPLAQYLLL